MERLRNLGIGTQIHYIPVYKQPYYSLRYGDIKLHGAEAFYGNCLSLPLSTKMKETDVVRDCETIDKILAK